MSFRSPDTAADGMTVWRELFAEFGRSILDDPTWQDTHDRHSTLGHVLVACLLDIVSDRSDPERSCQHIDTATRLIFR